MRLEAINNYIDCLNVIQERLTERLNDKKNEESRGLKTALSEIQNYKFDLIIKGLDKL